jgi:hypothetical protein
MRGLSLYLAAGILVVLALDIIAPPAGLGLSVGARPVVERGAIIQSVDRTHKGDRLPASAMSGKRPEQQKRAPVMVIGCDPAFTARMAGEPKNIPGRCVARVIAAQSVAG